MAIPLNILIVEDSETDAALLLGELRSAGYEASAKRVETETDYLASLQSLPDLIIADYRMPRLNGLRAMDLLRERGLDVPLILTFWR
jgi:CheY-like chemotaxis protein